MVQSFPDVKMTFAGTKEPCASVKLTSIGKINEKSNRENVKIITEFLESTLHIPKDRYAIILPKNYLKPGTCRPYFYQIPSSMQLWS